jgi:hypothetical protein
MNARAPVNKGAMEIIRQYFVPQLDSNGELAVVSFTKSQRSGCQVYSADLSAAGVTVEQLERALATEHELDCRFKSIQTYHVLETVTTANSKKKNNLDNYGSSCETICS